MEISATNIHRSTRVVQAQPLPPILVLCAMAIVYAQQVSISGRRASRFALLCYNRCMKETTYRQHMLSIGPSRGSGW
ncbi:hypothetical protein V8C44DRAFT_321219 [Trichoderma aethiopicum]